MNAASLASLALAPAVPDKVAVRTDSSRTTRRWAGGPTREPDLAGYRIVWRDTTAPFWQGSKFVGNVTETR